MGDNERIVVGDRMTSHPTITWLDYGPKGLRERTGVIDAPRLADHYVVTPTDRWADDINPTCFVHPNAVSDITFPHDPQEVI